MSDDTTETDPDEAEEHSDEQPEIDEDEKADFGGIDPEDIEDEAGADSDEDDSEGSDPSDALPTGGSSEGGTASGDTFGDMYCEGLAVSATVLREELGDGTGVDASLAHQIGLDEAFDEWVGSKGISEEMPPGQAVLVGTMMFYLATLGTDTDLMRNAAGEVMAA
jgi:hypothetical protein